jgi:hypothetical protein
LLKKGPVKQDVPSGFFTVSIMPSKRSAVVGDLGANVIVMFIVWPTATGFGVIANVDADWMNLFTGPMESLAVVYLRQ